MNDSPLEHILHQNATDPIRVSDETATRQLVTASAVKALLQLHGGAILGDEVGEGKTYVTFALIADALLRTPRKGATIFVPGTLLPGKWARQLQEYLRVAVRDQRAGRELSKRVITIGRDLRGDGVVGRVGTRPRRNSIVVARHNLFSFQTSDTDRAVCLEQWLQLRCPASRRPRQWLFERCGLRTWQANVGAAGWATPDVLSSACLEPVDEVWERRFDHNIDLSRLLRAKVREVRREVGRRVMPDAALVVVDEAHNLRSTKSQVYTSLMAVLTGNFDALLFLTATPFQLGRYELRNIVEFFRNARGFRTHSAAFDERVAAMEDGMSTYVGALENFGESWRLLDDTETSAAVDLALNPRRSLDLSRPTDQAAERFRECLRAKTQLEAGLRPFLIRSVRQRHQREIVGLEAEMASLAASSRIPLALVDRLIAEILDSKNRVFISSALTSACSSWEALFAAAITTNTSAEAHRTRETLMQVSAKRALGEHPKVGHTVRLSMNGIAAGEKTLIFVERTATGDRIRELIRNELGDWRSEAARERLQTPTRFGWPSLRENYLHTIYPFVFQSQPTVDECLGVLEREYAQHLWRLVDPDGRDHDYKIEKRLLEHVMFRHADRLERWRSQVHSTTLRACVENILDPRYILNGLDLMSGDSTYTRPIPSSPQRSNQRSPNLDFIRAYARYPSPWISCSNELATLMPYARAAIVDAAAAAIASSHLQAAVAAIETNRDPEKHFVQMDHLLRTSDPRWPRRFKSLAEFAKDEIAGQDVEQATARVEHLSSALRRSERVQFIHGSVALDTKQRAVDGFNTPLYPEVLIATDVLGEGLDLHRFCRRVIHHDLPWNPAKLEQRTGRVDRIGSMAERLALEDGDSNSAEISVWLPYMNGTYDESIFMRVTARRREFRCVLGNRPEWESHDDEGPNSQPIDENLVAALQVQLGPAELAQKGSR